MIHPKFSLEDSTGDGGADDDCVGDTVKLVERNKDDIPPAKKAAVSACMQCLRPTREQLDVATPSDEIAWSRTFAAVKCIAYIRAAVCGCITAAGLTEVMLFSNENAIPATVFSTAVTIHAVACIASHAIVSRTTASYTHCNHCRITDGVFCGGVLYPGALWATGESTPAAYLSVFVCVVFGAIISKEATSRLGPGDKRSAPCTLALIGTGLFYSLCILVVVTATVEADGVTPVFAVSTFVLCLAICMPTLFLAVFRSYDTVRPFDEVVAFGADALVCVAANLYLAAMTTR